MHVQHSVHIRQPIQQVSEALLDAPSKWFPKSVGVHVAGIPVRKRVTVEFGEPVKTTTWAVIPISWRPTFAKRLLPVMHGKVDVSPVSKEETRLTVSGMYEPPLGRLGEQLDEVVMHNVAEGTVKELAEVIAGRLGKSVKA
jgi:Polyketide cyclase / dehydrase and lipid transport